jgi:hypothetical protein
MGPTGYPETLVTNYQSTLYNIPGEQRFDFQQILKYEEILHKAPKLVKKKN